MFFPGKYFRGSLNLVGPKSRPQGKKAGLVLDTKIIKGEQHLKRYCPPG